MSTVPTQNTAARSEQPADQPSTTTPAEPEGVSVGRATIDRLDAEILQLIAARVEASARVQRARIASGGRRLSLAREADILARYREALGKPGITIAMALLDLCRGPLASHRQPAPEA
jgi:chorismate mutase